MRSMLATLMALCLVLTACGGAGPATAASPSARLGGSVTIFAAASLTDALGALAAEFRKDEPGVTFKPSYAGSSTLVQKIIQGADADIFASADEANMNKLVAAKLADGDPRLFAGNRLQIVVQAGNPKGITQLADLARKDVTVVLAAPAVPVGAYGQQAFGNAGVTVTPKSLESDVKQVVAKVALGEADAGIVYATDVRAGGPKIQGIDIPDRFNVTARYPIAVVKGSRNADAARAFIDFVLSPRGRAVLAGFGFLAP